MAWAATETFDSYTAGANIDTQNGGTGWSAAWTLLTGTSPVLATAPAGGQGCRALLMVATDGYPTRVVGTPQTTSTVHWMWYDTDGTSGHSLDILMRSSTNAGGGANGSRFGVTYNNGGAARISATDGQSYATLLTTYSTNAWHTVDITFGHNAGKFKVSIDGGSYSSDFNMGGGTSEVDQWGLFNSGQNNTGIYFDDFGPTANATCVTTNIKNFNGLAYGSVSNVCGLAPANIKNINGLA